MSSVIGTVSTSIRKGINVNGTRFSKDGRDFSGIGVNHFALFLNSFTDMGVGGVEPASIDIRAIARTWGLPFIRFSAGLFTAERWYNQYYLIKSTYFARLDTLVAEAEANNIGLMPAIIWDIKSFCELSFEVDGVLSPPADLAIKTSRSWQLYAELVTEIVTRYKDSPAIYAWNIGNELINKCGAEYHTSWEIDGTQVVGGSTLTWLDWEERPGGGNYLASDKLTMSGWREFTRNAIALIRSLDDSGRLITSGTPMGNSFAARVQTTSTLSADTLAQWDTGFNGKTWINYRDEYFDQTSTHCYPQNTVFSADAPSNSHLHFFDNDQKTQAELFALHKVWSDRDNKPFFLEEFGATQYGDTVDQISTTPEQEKTNFNLAIQAIIDNDIRLSAVWNYGGSLTGASAWQRWKLNSEERRYQLEIIAALNATMNN